MQRMRAIIVLGLLTLLSLPFYAEKPRFARKGRAFTWDCKDRCEAISPNGMLSIRPILVDENAEILHLGVFHSRQKLGEVSVLYGTIYEVLWAPNSEAFAVTVAPNAYTESSFVWRLVGNKVEKVPIDAFIFTDMIKTFPPCRASNVTSGDCHQIEQNPQFNVAAVAWENNGTLVLMSEIPCSSSYGGVMCQLRGYEFRVNDGVLLRSLNAREFKHRWQVEAAWNIRIPEAPSDSSKDN